MKATADSSISVMAAQNTKEAGEKLDLPMSATVGFNWDRALWLEKLHLCSSVTWTEWSTLDKIDLGLSDVMELGWHNAYRAGFGFEYDLADWITPGMGYVYDWDPMREKRPNTMIPMMSNSTLMAVTIIPNEFHLGMAARRMMEMPLTPPVTRLLGDLKK